jgi:hypothetical protein
MVQVRTSRAIAPTGSRACPDASRDRHFHDIHSALGEARRDRKFVGRGETDAVSQLPIPKRCIEDNQLFIHWSRC